MSEGFFKELSCCVCHNSYEIEELTFYQDYLCCVLCIHEWQVYKSKSGKDSFEKWAMDFRVELEEERNG